MPLIEHLRELRNRFLVAATAIVLATIPGWQLYNPLLEAITKPLLEQGGTPNMAGLTDPFAVQLQMAITFAFIVASPVWLYEIWAFIVPGLTKKEKRTALVFVLTAAPLFLAGCYLAYLTLPKAVEILLGFTPEGASNIILTIDYLGFVTRFLLAFGFAFLLPVFLVALNLIGVLSARAMLRAWRFAVVGIFIFAAIMTPTPDPWTMFSMALPMVALYFGAVGIAWLVDRRREKHRPDWTDLDDDEASALDLDAAGFDDEGDGQEASSRRPIESSGRIEPAGALETRPDTERD